ncbi:MAG: DUF3135 domain-containing protein [Gammaproteobacteria bacterium]|nr:DUF3135 domain-containing protein [Gammaproteobacteria bacterium]
MSHPSSSFDFDEWMTLAKTDPEAFAVRRREAIESVLASAPEERQQRLRGLQWSIDMELQKCSNPMQGCMRLFNRMWDSVYGEKGLLNALLLLGELESYPSSKKQPDNKPLESATILPFKATKPVV